MYLTTKCRLFLLFISVCVVACSKYKKPSNDAPGTIKLGLLAPFDGSNYPYLLDLHRGADLVLGTNNDIQGIYENSDRNGYNGSNILQGLVSKNTISAILGPVHPKTIIEIRSLANMNKIIHFSCFSNPLMQRPLGSYGFSNVPSDSKQIDLMLSFLSKDLHAKKVSIVHQLDAYQTILLRHLIKALIKEHIEVTLVHLEESASAAKPMYADAVVVLSRYTATRELLKNLELELPTAAILCREGSIRESELENINQQNIYCVRLPIHRNRRFYRNFRKDFRDFHAELNMMHPTWFNDEPNVYEAYAYEATTILAEAVQAVGADPKHIRRYLTSSNFSSLTGRLNFNDYGEVNRDFELARVMDGAFVTMNQLEK